MSEALYIVAGNVREARDAAWRHGLTARQFRPVLDYDTLRGRRGFPFVYTGTWYQRRDLDEIQRMLREREAVETTFEAFKEQHDE